MRTDHTALLMLLNWMSPTFPIGSFAYSHGMEQAIADGRLKAADTVEGWISDLVRSGSGWNDAVIFALCWKEDIGALNETALALSSSAERYMETTDLGRNFNIAASVWMGVERKDEVVAYPVAAGRACRTMGIDRDLALIAFLQGYCAALVSVAVRLVPLGQTSGLKILRNISPSIADVAGRAAISDLDNIGSACIAAEIASMQHETLEPRIFRT